MRAALRLLALPSSIGTQSSGMKAVPPALLPPIPLYRRILRGHRKYLPREMRLLGDEYVKSEFRAHKDVENPMHIVRTLASIERTNLETCTDTGPDRLPCRMAGLRSADRG